MTTNFNRFKQMKEDASKSKGPISNLRWFKSEAGKTYTMRFLPLKSQDLEFPVEVYHHHAISFPDGHFESIPCSKRINNESCPFCELATKEYKTFTKTGDEAHKDAFKKLVAKTHYLLVGYDVNTVNPKDLKQDDVVIVRASARTTMELIDNQLAKGRDFIDYNEGRNIELLKAKGNTMTPVAWDVQDSGRADLPKDAWDKLVEISPDLKQVVTPLSHSALMAKFEEFSSTPLVSDESEDEEEEVRNSPALSMPKSQPVATSSKKKSKEADIDLDELRNMMDED